MANAHDLTLLTLQAVTSQSIQAALAGQSAGVVAVTVGGIVGATKYPRYDG